MAQEIYVDLYVYKYNYLQPLDDLIYFDYDTTLFVFDDIFGDNYPSIFDDNIRSRSYLEPHQLEESSCSWSSKLLMNLAKGFKAPNLWKRGNMKTRMFMRLGYVWVISLILKAYE